jgi:hypothetical protein
VRRRDADRRFESLPDAGELRAALSAEADSYEPDPEAILAVVECGRNGSRAGPPAGAASGRTAAGRLSWLAAAAAVLAAVAGVRSGVLSLGVPGSPPPRSLPALPASMQAGGADGGPGGSPSHLPTGLPSGPTAIPSDGSPSSGAPGAPQGRSATPPRSSGPTGSSGVTGRATSSGQPGSGQQGSGQPALPAPALAGRALPAGTQFDLPRAGDLDWVVVGARRDGVTVREKAGSGAIDVPVPTGGTPAVASAPVTLSWSGGSPEQDHVQAGTWWTVPTAGAGWQVTVRPSGPGAADLLLGATGSAVLVTASVRPSGSGGSVGSLGVARSDSTASLVTVRWGAVPAGATVVITVTAGTGASGGRLGLLAVALH